MLVTVTVSWDLLLQMTVIPTWATEEQDVPCSSQFWYSLRGHTKAVLSNTVAVPVTTSKQANRITLVPALICKVTLYEVNDVAHGSVDMDDPTTCQTSEQWTLMAILHDLLPPVHRPALVRVILKDVVGNGLPLLSPVLTGIG
jgi:hypothetical protein